MVHDTFKLVYNVYAETQHQRRNTSLGAALDVWPPLPIVISCSRLQLDLYVSYRRRICIPRYKV